MDQFSVSLRIVVDWYPTEILGSRPGLQMASRGRACHLWFELADVRYQCGVCDEKKPFQYPNEASLDGISSTVLKARGKGSGLDYFGVLALMMS